MDSKATHLPTYGLAINVYGRGDATLGDGPSHVGIVIYEISSSTCEIYHIRNPTDVGFIYDPRIQPLEDPVLRGRCELGLLSQEQKERTTHLLSAFGKDESNIPEWGVGNCQDWVAGAVAMLDREGLVNRGEGEFWRSMINRSADEMKESCLRTGRKWIVGSESTFEGVPDARFSDKEDPTKSVGKLMHNSIFQDRIRSLLGNAKDTGASTIEDTPQERPFYISSPFFSFTPESNGKAS
ncbi:hypothetical protein DTO217A2_3163 [Paecilomyces variotii]|nr:hypothetical protein DTO217A2_3163 [Paecilomyces variotii]